MTKRRYKLTISFLALLILVFSCINKTEGLKQSDVRKLTNHFLIKHVQYHRMENALSERTLNNLISYIDPGKYYFFKKDIETFQKHKDEIGKYIDDEKFTFVFDMFSLYRKRFDEKMKLFDELIQIPYDFNQDETILIDSEKAEYARNDAEMRERWRKNIKLQLLNYTTAGKNVEDAKDKLKKKYVLMKKRMEEINNDRILSIFINAYSTALDPHSNYLSQEEHEDFMIGTKLKLEGIGVLLRSEDGFVLVESIMPGGAAAKLPEKLKLKPNDKIVGVAQGADEPSDVIDMELRDVVKLIRGKKGTEVRLTIIREADDKTHKQSRMVVPIIREEIKLEDKAAKSDIFTYTKGQKEIRIGYIKLPSFYLDFDAIQRRDPNAKSSSTDVIIEINKLKNRGIQGMVIDLRGNPGGALNEAISLAGLFIDQGPVVQVKDGNNNVEVLRDDDPGVYYDGPIVVLIDKFSASASEIFAGAIKDYRRGLIIGSTPTFGKGSVQTYNALEDKKGAVKITTALFYQPGGASNQLNGIAPDIVIPDLASVWDIGENKLKYPLKWEKIKRSNYVPYNNYLNGNLITVLNQNSSSRVRSNKKFADLIENIRSLKEKLSNKEISLKEESRLENQKIKDIEKKIRNDRDEKLIDLENDIFLKEAFSITVEYVEMLK